MATRKRKARGDSPINIGGGGGKRTKKRTGILFVDIKFNHNDYVQDKTGKYLNDQDSLGQLTITGVNPPDISDAKEVTIRCLNKDTGKTATITINVNPLGLSFNPDDFPYDQGLKKHDSSKSGKPRMITSVEIDGIPVLTAPGGGPRKIVADNLGKMRRNRPARRTTK